MAIKVTICSTIQATAWECRIHLESKVSIRTTMEGNTTARLDTPRQTTSRSIFLSNRWVLDFRISYKYPTLTTLVTVVTLLDRSGNDIILTADRLGWSSSPCFSKRQVNNWWVLRAETATVFTSEDCHRPAFKVQEIISLRLVFNEVKIVKNSRYSKFDILFVSYACGFSFYKNLNREI